MILVYVETSVDAVDEVSLETITFARSLSAAGGRPVDAVAVGPAPADLSAVLASYGVATSTVSRATTSRSSPGPPRHRPWSRPAKLPGQSW